MTDIQEAYKEDTVGRRYHTPILSKKGEAYKEPHKEPMITLNLNEPMSRDEFSHLNDSLRTIYIKHLHEQYGVTATRIANMLGYSTGHFSKIVLRLGLRSLFDRGKAMSKEEINAWDEFLKNGNEKDIVSVPTSEYAAPPIIVCDCSFTLRGALSITEITNKIQALVKEGTFCSVNINIEVLEKDK